MAKRQYKGTLRSPGGRPQDVDLVLDRVPQLTDAEAAAGFQWVDDRYLPGDIRRYGLVGGTSDDTTELTDYFDTLSASLDFVYTIPEGFKFNKRTVLNSLPAGVKIVNNSGYDWDATSTTSRFFGILAQDSGPNDSGWAIESGHHPILLSNNYGTAGTGSAGEYKTSWFWSGGVFQNGGLTQRGQRSVGCIQWNLRSGTPETWDVSILSWAPGDALEDQYEYWSSGESISIGDCRLGSNEQHYKAASAGTAANEPTHTDGSTQSGADTIDWEHIGTFGATRWVMDEHGRQAWGGESITGFLNTRPNIHDPDGGTNTQTHSARGTSKDVLIVLKPTNGSDAVTAVPYIRAAAADGLKIVKSDSSGTTLTFTDTATDSAVPFGLPSYTVAGVPSAATAGRLIYVSDETGGAVVAFSDGTNWRRVTDRAVVS